MKRDTVFVIGAGAAGLSAAATLREAGLPVVVLENGAEPGGRMHTVTTDEGFLIDTGAMLVADGYTAVMDRMHRLGFDGELVRVDSRTGFARDGRLELLDTDHLARSGITTRLLGLRSKFHLGKALLDLRRARPLLDPEDLSRAAPLDFESVAQYADRRLDAESYDWLVEPAVRGMLGVRGDETSVVDLFYVMERLLGARMFAPRAGMGSYARALAEPLDVRTRAHVEEVRPTADGVRVDWRSGSDHESAVGAGAVVAVPGDRVPAVLPWLTGTSRDYLDDLRYTQALELKVELARPPGDFPGVMVVVPRRTHAGLFAVSFDHNLPGRVPAGRGLVGLWVSDEWARELADTDDGEVIERVVAAGDTVLPGLGKLVQGTHLARWRASVVASHPGMYRRMVGFMADRPAGRIALAGDYFATSNLEAATAAGNRAAREVMDAVGTRPHRTSKGHA